MNSAVSQTAWDVVVVGAGPAGSLVARELARRGRKVLLADKAAFPRWKVCGCCLSGSALATLRSVGLGDLPSACGAIPLKKVLLSSGKRSATLRLPAGVSLSREAFDWALIREAVRAGAEFLPETSVSLPPMGQGLRPVELRERGRSFQIEARIVVAADGLNGTLLGENAPAIVAGSRIGAGAVVESPPDFYGLGTVFMACGSGGYVGLVRLEDGRLDVAAAFNPAFVRESGGLGSAAERILAETDWPKLDDLPEQSWKGTPALTRRPTHLGTTRLFAVGDSAGYIEPFTGEGMAWALSSAAALAPLVHEAIDRWDNRYNERWIALHRQLIGKRQRYCHLLTRVLRSPRWSKILVGLLSFAPSLARPFLGHLNRAPVSFNSRRATVSPTRKRGGNIGR